MLTLMTVLFVGGIGLGILWVTVRVLKYMRFQREQNMRMEGLMDDKTFAAYLAQLKKQHAKDTEASAQPQDAPKS